MTFSTPSLLFAFGILIIPVIIHLFNFKRFKKIYFSNVSFLKDIKQESEKKSKLKHLLVLLSRILALSALIFAFSQPIILKNQETSGSNDIAIYIDNSFSMNSKNENGQLFEQSKEAAIKLVENYGQSYQYYIATNELLGKHTHPFSKNAVLEEIKNITLSPETSTFNQIQKRFETLNENMEVFYFSDFQKSTVNINEIKSSLSESLLIPIQSNKNTNLFIDSIWFSSPNRSKISNEKLFIRVINQADDEVEFKLNLTINSSVVAFSESIVPSESEIIIELSYSSIYLDEVKGELSLSDYGNSEVIFDDQYYFAYTTNNNTTTTIINNEDNKGSLQKLFLLDSTSTIFSIENKQIDYNLLAQSNLIILNQLKSFSSGFSNQLLAYLAQGKTIVIIPNDDIVIESYNALFSSIKGNLFQEKIERSEKLNSIDKSHQFFQNIFLSTDKQMDLPLFSSKYTSISHSKSNENVIIKFINGSSFLTQTPYKSGFLYKFHASLFNNKFDFSHHALFVPIMLRIKELSSQYIATNFTIGNENKINTNFIPKKELNFEERTSFELSNNNISFIPKLIHYNFTTFLEIGSDITKDGFYALTSKSNPSISIPFAFNYNRTESYLETYSHKELRSQANDKNFTVLDSNNAILGIEQHIKELKGTSLWIYFIFAALLFFLIEILLIRFLK